MLSWDGAGWSVEIRAGLPAFAFRGHRACVYFSPPIPYVRLVRKVMAEYFDRMPAFNYNEARGLVSALV